MASSILKQFHFFNILLWTFTFRCAETMLAGTGSQTEVAKVHRIKSIEVEIGKHDTNTHTHTVISILITQCNFLETASTTLTMYLYNNDASLLRTNSLDKCNNFNRRNESTTSQFYWLGNGKMKNETVFMWNANTIMVWLKGKSIELQCIFIAYPFWINIKPCFMNILLNSEDFLFRAPTVQKK